MIGTSAFVDQLTSEQTTIDACQQWSHHVVVGVLASVGVIVDVSVLVVKVLVTLQCLIVFC